MSMYHDEKTMEQWMEEYERETDTKVDMTVGSMKRFTSWLFARLGPENDLPLSWWTRNKPLTDRP